MKSEYLDTVESTTELGTSMLVTVIIPTFNRCDVLRRCLAALAAGPHGELRLEVIVADDGSSDGTPKMVECFSESAPFRVLYFRQQNAGPSVARNRALRMASGAIALIINDDTIVGPDCIASHAATHCANPDVRIAVLGRVTLSPDVPRTLFSDLHLDASFAHFAGRDELDWKAFITCNLSVKPRFLIEHGMFDERMFPHEDLELGRRLAAHGLRILYRPQGIAYHYHHLTERDYLHAAVQDGRALARWYRKEPTAEPLLQKLGLQGQPPLQRNWKQRLAESVIEIMTPAVATSLTRAVSRVSLTGGVFFYRRLYQHVRRKSIDVEMQNGPNNPTTAF